MRDEKSECLLSATKAHRNSSQPTPHNYINLPNQVWTVWWQMMKSRSTIGYHNHSECWWVENTPIKKHLENLKYCLKRKIMATVFWDSDRILLKYLSQGSTITSELYFDILLHLHNRSLNWSDLENCHKKSYSCIATHEHVCSNKSSPHKSEVVSILSSALFVRFSSSGHSISGLKKLLWGRNFLTDSELCETVSIFFKKQDTE